MRSRLFVMMTAFVLTAPAALAAQAVDARGAAQGQAKTPAARIDAAIEAAAAANVPVTLLESKVREGEAKRVPLERIAGAVEARLEALLRASETLKRGGVEVASAGELAVTADALEAGVSDRAIIRVSTSAPGERRIVAVAVLADLVRLGHGSDPAYARVNAALISNAALANLHAEVASQLRLGGLTSTLDVVGQLGIQ